MLLIFLWFKMGKKNNEITVGGQAVIEGVMMRSYTGYATAVWTDDKLIVQKVKYTPLTRKFKILNLPFLRGVISFFEMMIIGIKTLNFSAEIAIEQEEKKEGENKEIEKQKHTKKSNNWTIFFTILFALGLGIALFFWLPLTITNFIISKESIFYFNLMDAAIRLTFFLLYIYLISLMKDIKRLFEFHGAEHKTVFAYENKEKLTYENIKKYSTFHPRCGTSFLVLVMLISVLVFSIGDSIVFSLGYPNTFLTRFISHFIWLPVIAGVSYEMLRFSGKYPDSALAKAFSFFGLLLQRITTQEPDEKQIMAAKYALEKALSINENQEEKEEIEECLIN